MSWIDTLPTERRDALKQQYTEARARNQLNEVAKWAGDDEGYALWLWVTDSTCWRRKGVSIFDLADACWGDWYSDGMSPAEALSCAISAEFGGELE